MAEPVADRLQRGVNAMERALADQAALPRDDAFQLVSDAAKALVSVVDRAIGELNPSRQCVPDGSGHPATADSGWDWPGRRRGW